MISSYIRKVARRKNFEIKGEIPASKNFSIILVKKGGLRYIIKCLRNKKASSLKKFRHEAYLCKFFSQHNNPNFLLPVSCTVQEKTYPYYFIYQYVPGQPISWYYFFANKKYPADKVADLSFYLHSLSKSINHKKVFARSSKENMAWYESFYPGAKKLLSAGLLKAISRIIYNKPELFNDNGYLCHGDFHGRNVIEKSGKICFIDWGDFQFNIKSYDLSLLWMMSWNRPLLQKTLLNKFLQKYPKDQELFYLTVLFFIPKYFSILNDIRLWLVKNKKHYDNRRQSTMYKQALIWYKKEIPKLLSKVG